MILVEDKLDISQKLNNLPKFLPARSEQQTKEQKAMAKEVFYRHKDFSLFDILHLGMVLYFYTHYKKDVDPYNEFEEKFDSLFLLNDEELYSFITERLVDVIHMSTPV